MDDSDDDNFDPLELATVRNNFKLKEAERLAGSEVDEEDPSTDVETSTIQELKAKTNNEAGLVTKFREITQQDLPWIERLDFSTPHPLSLQNAHDDLKREAQFYALSLQGVGRALVQLDQARIPYVRPSDYFAEMIKPDSQMTKIKDALLKEKRRMDQTAERRKAQDSRKFAKQAKSEKRQEREKYKKDNLNAIKANKGQGDAQYHSTVGTIDAALQRVQKDKDGNKKAGGEKNKSRKRKQADEKYGHGGKKKHHRSNDATSARDVSSFSLAKQRAGPTGFSKNFQKGGSNKKGGSKRPGKNARANARK